MDATDEAVLAAIERDVLTVTALAKAMTTLQAPPRDDRTGARRQELARLEAELARLAQAIAAGGEIPGLVAAMQERERRCAHLRGELATVERQAAVTRRGVDVEGALATMRAALTDWRTMLRQAPSAARLALTSLLAGRLVFTPRTRDGARFYEFEVPGTISKVIAGLALPRGVVTHWCP